MSSGQTICGISKWVTWLMLIAGTRMACEAHVFSDPLRDNKHVRCWHIVLCVFRAWSGFYVSSLYLDTEPKALSRGAMLQPFQLCSLPNRIGPGDQTIWNSHHSH